MLQTDFSALAAHSTYKKNQEQRNAARPEHESGSLAVVWAPGFLLLEATGPLIYVV